MTVHSTPPRKTEYAGVVQDKFASALDLFCLFGAKGVKRTAKSSQPKMNHVVHKLFCCPRKIRCSAKLHTLALCSNSFYKFKYCTFNSYANVLHRIPHNAQNANACWCNKKANVWCWFVRLYSKIIHELIS